MLKRVHELGYVAYVSYNSVNSERLSVSDNLEIGSPWGNRNLAEVKFQIYILYNQDDKIKESQCSAGCSS